MFVSWASVCGCKFGSNLPLRVKWRQIYNLFLSNLWTNMKSSLLAALSHDIKKVNRIIYNFLWNGKDKVNRSL